MEGTVHIGTSGWSYREWRDAFYPASVKAADYLAYYATRFNTTEINSSYYNIPKVPTVKRWQDIVNQNFRFCPKMNRQVTHYKRLADPEQTLPDFFQVFGIIKDQLGPVLIQLPPSLIFEKEKTTLFYKALKDYAGYQFALEPRHASWLGENSIELMKQYHISFVIADWGKATLPEMFITSNLVYIRFHGSARYDKPYTGGSLQGYAKKINQWTADGLVVWAFFNNTAKGHAVENAQQLISLTGKRSL